MGDASYHLGGTFVGQVPKELLPDTEYAWRGPPAALRASGGLLGRPHSVLVACVREPGHVPPSCFLGWWEGHFPSLSCLRVQVFRFLCE